MVQRSDDVAVVHNSTVVFACDGKARATFAASWYRQLGLQNIYVVIGGATAWSAIGQDLEEGMSETAVFGEREARTKVRLVSPQVLRESPPPLTIFLDTSQDFARGHVPGAQWLARSWLELRIDDLAPSKDTPIAVTCTDGRNSILGGAALMDMGYRDVRVLEEGMSGWHRAALPVEMGLSGIMTPPTDVLYSGPDRNYADMMNYLRWETALGEKYAK